LHTAAVRGFVLLALVAAAQPQLTMRVPDLQFHHLHLGDGRPGMRLEFYERMFDKTVVRRIRFANADGLQTGTRRILISSARPQEEQPAALWHFGWGAASLGDTYLAHARREVAWDPPLPHEALHLHLRSVAPLAAAAWYRDTLGASVQIAETAARTGPLPAPEHRFPDALVTLRGLSFLIYPTDRPLASSSGYAIDHVAFACADLDDTLFMLRRRKVTVLRDIAVVDGARTAMIEGPDLIPIELVELFE
jgi:hypothetical protein